MDMTQFTMIPPPMDLVKKSAVVLEEAQSGAEIAFLKLQKLIGEQRLEKLNADNMNKGAPPDRNGDIPMNTILTEYLITAANKGIVVYCRLGEKYIADLEKRKKSILADCN